MTMRITSPFAGLEHIVEENAPLARHTWYRLGGPAKYLIRPRTVDELQDAARRCSENGIPIYVLGLGANLLIKDEGIDGAVFKLDEDEFRKVTFDKNLCTARAGVDLQKLILRTIRDGQAGLEILAGIPGTIGGAIRMNAGGKFGDIGATVRSVTVMDPTGTIFERHRDDLIFDYRKTNIVAPFILDAVLELDEEDPDDIIKRCKEVWMYKRNTQPLNTKNCGCVFKNPRGLSAGAVIDQAGLKGLRVGGAEVSTKHANFLVAHPGCTSSDVLNLIKTIQERVMERKQIELEPEVKVWPLATA